MTQRDMRGGNCAAELQDPAVYNNRRRRLAELVGEGTVVLWGAGDDRGAGDVGTFCQSPEFFYLIKDAHDTLIDEKKRDEYDRPFYESVVDHVLKKIH